MVLIVQEYAPLPEQISALAEQEEKFRSYAKARISDNLGAIPPILHDWNYQHFLDRADELQGRIEELERMAFPIQHNQPGILNGENRQI